MTTAQCVAAGRQATSAKDYSFILTDAELAAWRALAATTPVLNRLGQSVTLSGQQIFCKLNNIIAMLGGTRITTPPGSLVVSSPISVTIAATTPGTLDITPTVAAAGANEYAIVYITPPLNPGRSFVSSQLRQIPGALALNAVNHMAANYELIFGSIPAAGGQRIFVRWYVANVVTGAASASYQDSSIWS